MQDKNILKYLKGRASQVEQELLEKWATSSPENASYFNKVKAFYIASTLDKKTKDIDIDKAYSSFKTSNTSKTLSLPKKKRNYTKYAVAACLFLGLFVSIYFLSQSNSAGQTDTVITQESDIKIGSDKATLILEDGSAVEIQKGKNYKANNAISNGKELIYKNSEAQSSSEVTYNYLMIPRGGQFFVELSDHTKIWLNSESKLKYPTTFIAGKTREVELIYGEAYFEVSPSKENGGSQFKVHTQNQDVLVLGTQFNIRAYQDENSIYTTLVEGKVNIEAHERKENLKPNEQSIVNSNNQVIQISKVDVFNEISWKEGIFSFERKSLKDIMKVLARWYDFETVFETKKIEAIEFTGILDKDQKLEDILLTVKNLGYISSFGVENKKIILK